jgi:hypothetical protein
VALQFPLHLVEFLRVQRWIMARMEGGFIAMLYANFKVAEIVHGCIPWPLSNSLLNGIGGRRS